MTDNEFLRQIAENYLEYLTLTDKGYENIKIRSVSSDIFGLYLQLEYPLKSLESLFLRSPLGEFALNEEESSVQVGFYDEKARKLFLNIEHPLSTELFKYKDSLELISDLKFLVRNLINFYARELPLGLPSSLPTLTPDIEALNTLPTPPNAEQLQSLRGIFSSSFCYVWGAAGSGKTKVVLLHALAFYLKVGAKVAILAPTNNALEQCLYTLIDSLEQIGFATQTILRTGTPTQKFLEKYPDHCEINLLETPKNPKDSLQNAQIIAMTLDTFLHRSDLQSLDFAHYFVDEAAFTPLIKVIPLCAFDKPITLLGDHKQLQPICALEDKDSKDLKWKRIAFWKYSALFLEMFFKNEALKSLTIHPQTTPQIENLFTLKQSYRYGDNLAQLLDRYIYHNHLQGCNTHTHLYCFDVSDLPKNAESKERTNHNEALQCCELARSFLQQNVEFAILTPFVNQRRLILKLMPTLFPFDCVFTIHSAQGQEFDFVIFSPVILHYHLNDSQNPNALFALNVALSRAKKALIIVCDKPYWLRQRGQFLSDLIRIAQPYIALH